MIKRYRIHIEDEDVVPIVDNIIGNWVKWDDVIDTVRQSKQLPKDIEWYEIGGYCKAYDNILKLFLSSHKSN